VNLIFPIENIEILKAQVKNAEAEDLGAAKG
jgi:ribosomal protein S3AE